MSQESLVAHGPLLLDFPSPKAKCNLSYMNYMYDEMPQSSFERNEAELWHMLLLALAVTRTAVKEIRSVDEDCEHALSVNAFRMSQPQARNLVDSFQCILFPVRGGLRHSRGIVSNSRTYRQRFGYCWQSGMHPHQHCRIH